MTSISANIKFDNQYRQLPERFFSEQLPTPVSAPGLIRINDHLATDLNINAKWLASEEGIATLAGNHIPTGAEPIASVYAGHQFGNWNPQLGDGRAVLLGEVIGKDGIRYDLQLKGAGPTPYSRGGDGRAPLGPVLREYIVSEAMFALRVPTSRSLAAVTTGEQVMREQVEPGAVLTRVAKSHIRVGSFQFFAARGDTDAVRLLADHAIARHYPHCLESDAPYLKFLEAVISSTADLIAKWQQLGFIHGVMNTDNQLISGETIDYGPCAFLDAYQPDTVFSSIDSAGRYAYQNQPGIAHWNLANFAQCLVPLINDNEEAAVETAKETLDQFPGLFYAAHRAGMAAKIGFKEATEQTDELIRDLLSTMSTHNMDFTQTFASLSDESVSHDQLKDWMPVWRQSLTDESAAYRLMEITNPKIIPRNHGIEAAIQAALVGDFTPFHDLVDALQNPFNSAHVDGPFYQAPTEAQMVHRTFCGT